MANNTTRFKKRSLLQRVVNYIKVYIVKRKGCILGDNTYIMGGVPFVKRPQNGVVKIGNNVIINSDFKKSNSSLTYKCKFTTGYNGRIEIGDNCDLNGTCIMSYDSVRIGSFVQIASATYISDTDSHPIDNAERLNQMSGKPYSFDSVAKKPILIGDNTWIGWNVTILKGTIIGKNCIVAAGSVLTGSKTFPDNSIIAGNPAKVIKMNI